MAAINEYPKFNSVEDLPYTISLRLKLNYAKDFTPHKVAYYEELLKQWLLRAGDMEGGICEDLNNDNLQWGDRS